MKGKKIVSVFVTLAAASTMILGVSAFAARSNGDSEALTAVYDYVEAMDSQDWDKYISLSPSSEYENLMEFLYNEENEGVHNVKSAEIVDIRELAPVELPQYVLVEDIVGEAPQENVRAYLIAANLEVKEETKYHYNGVNMFTVLLARESGTWKVFAFSAAPASIIKSVYANSGSDANFDVDRMIDIATKHQNLIWENAAGEVIEDNRAATVERSSNTLQSLLHFMDEQEILGLIGDMPVTYSSELYLEDIPTETLSRLFSDLQAVQTHSIEDDNDKWDAIQEIGEVLEKKYQEGAEGDPVQVIEGVISKDYLIKLIEDKMDMCKAILQTPEPIDPALLENGAVMSFEEEQKVTAELLEALTEFLDEVKKNATQENIYSYWNRYWTDILQDKVPSGYVLAE